MSEFASLCAARDWEPSQSKHATYCGMQGPHSLGRGKRGSCTCGRDELVAERLRLREALAVLSREFEMRGQLAASPEDVAMYLRIVNEALADEGTSQVPAVEFCEEPVTPRSDFGI